MPSDDDGSRAQSQSRHFPIFAVGDRAGGGGGGPPSRQQQQQQQQQQQPHHRSPRQRQQQQQQQHHHHVDVGGSGGFAGYWSKQQQQKLHDQPRHVNHVPPVLQQQLPEPPKSLRRAVRSSIPVARSESVHIDSGYHDYNVKDYLPQPPQSPPQLQEQQYQQELPYQQEHQFASPSRDAEYALYSPPDFGGAGSSSGAALKENYAQQYTSLGGLGGLSGLDVSAASWSHRD